MKFTTLSKPAAQGPVLSYLHAVRGQDGRSGVIRPRMATSLPGRLTPIIHRRTGISNYSDEDTYLHLPVLVFVLVWINDPPAFGGLFGRLFCSYTRLQRSQSSGAIVFKVDWPYSKG